jgi:hypothetical protein
MGFDYDEIKSDFEFLIVFRAKTFDVSVRSLV